MPALPAVEDFANGKSWPILRPWIPARAANALWDIRVGIAATNSSRGTQPTVEPAGQCSGNCLTTRKGSTTSRRRFNPHTWSRCVYTFTATPLNWHSRRRPCTKPGDADEMKHTPTPFELVAMHPSESRTPARYAARTGAGLRKMTSGTRLWIAFFFRPRVSSKWWNFVLRLPYTGSLSNSGCERLTYHDRM